MYKTTYLVPSTAQQSTPLPIIEYIILFDKSTVYTVPKAFYDAIKHQVENVIPVLKTGEKYTLKALCGKTFWDQLNDGECRMAGRCMVDMVAKNLLPLSFAESRHEYPMHYRLA